MIDDRKRIALIGGAILLVLLLLLLSGGVFFFLRNGGFSVSNGTNAANHNQAEALRENTLKLAGDYLAAGQFQRTLDLLASLLIENPGDAEAKALHERALAEQQIAAANGDADRLAEILVRLADQGINGSGLSRADLQALIEAVRNNNAEMSRAVLQALLDSQRRTDDERLALRRQSLEQDRMRFEAEAVLAGADAVRLIEPATAVSASGGAVVFLPITGEAPADNQEFHDAAGIAAGAARPSPLKGMYVDAAPQYYIMPEGIGGIFYRVSSALPGFRAGAGVLLSLGPGDLGLGTEAGYNRLTYTGNSALEVNTISIVFKADYTLGLPWLGMSLRPSLGMGWLLNLAPSTKHYDFVMAARANLHWPFTPFLDIPYMSLYFGAGADILPEREGAIIMPAVELGLRFLPFSMKRGR